MNPGQLTKVIYHTDTKKINKYIKFTSIYHEILGKVLQNCPYEQAINDGVRLFWIDEENDEIDINSQESLEIYETCTLGVERRHLHVDAVKADGKNEKADKASTNQTEIPPAAGSYEFAVHDNVECDACLMAPIIGFRYKCIQCPNYDLCQNCESKHTHSEHMMVRMPTNNCPSVVETYITGRSSGRKHGKRAKTSCPFVKNGLSVVIDDDGEGSQAVGGGGEGSEQAMPSNGKERHHGRRHHRRHQRHSFLQNLYEMMHDLAEGGGAAAAAHAMGEDEEPPACSTKTTSSTTGPHTTTTTQSTCNDKNFEENISNVQVAAQQAHEAAMKAAEIAAKVAHETAVQAAKNISVSMSAAPAPTADAQSNATSSTDMNNKNKTDKVDATTSPGMANTSVPSTPSLEALTQFLDPQYMKTGIQILNNFSDMFAKMLDPLDNEVGSGTNEATSPPCSFNTTNSRKNSTASSKSTVSSQQNSINSEKKLENEKPIEKQQNSNEEEEEAIKELNKQTESDVSSHVGIEDLGSDSENDSDSFIKLDAPQEASFNKSGTTTANISAQNTPPQSLNKSNVMDFAQLSADLKAHIAEEAAKSNGTSVETGVAVTEQVKPNTTANTTEPVVSTTAATPTNQERRAIPVYHANERINNAVLAMMAMGFSNEGAWLTQLLESVDGNIDDALELMPVAPRGGR